MPPKKSGSAAERNFILQQGFYAPESETCHLHYSALLFQPRIVGLIVLSGVVFQRPFIFLALSLVLWWNALVSSLNPFDAIYNVMVRSKDTIRLTPAPMPRRFAQGMAGTFALIIGLLLLAGRTVTAFVIEGIMLAAIAALVFGRFCLGSFVYHLLRGQGDFARRTLPWKR